MLPKVVRQFKIPFLRSLTDPQVPEFVVHNVCVKYIRTYIKGIMRFQDPVDVRRKVADHGSGQQHAAGFPAHHAGSHHVIPYLKVILRTKVFFHEDPQVLIPGHHNVAHPCTLFFNRDPVLMQQFCLIEKAIPGIGVLFLQRPLASVHDLIKAAGLNAVLNGLYLPR